MILKIMKSKNQEITKLPLNRTQSFVCKSLCFHYVKLEDEFMQSRSELETKV